MKRARLALMLLLLASPAAAQPDSLMRRVLAAERQFMRGERAEAMRVFDSFLDVYNAGAARLASQELVAVAIACTYLGQDNPQLFRDALRAYDEAIAKDPRNLDARVRLAELFLSRYNSADAKRAIAEALRQDGSHVPALIVEARRRDFDHEPGADSVLARALREDADNVAARTLLARFRADVESFTSAATEIDRALASAGDDLDALAFAAALRFVTGDSAGYRAARSRFASLYPRNAAMHVATAELLGRVRQYARAATVAREGTQLDPRNWRAHAVLGNNLLRLGRVEEARGALETAFRGDPYDLWTKNTLDLLDTFGEYDVVRRGPFELMIEKAESELLGLYLGELAERAHAVFAPRYGFRPAERIRMEVYRSHADFSVRTVGLAGLGALGVSFGNTVAFDSPAARDMGTFNWGSTAWHELAHTFTLGASDMRVPRWFSEGLSVYEERRARPGWGQRVSPAFLRAYAQRRLYPASRLNDGFIRPQYPQQVMHSYYQASLVCEMIAKDFGERALMDLLRAYRDGQDTPQAIRSVLKLDLPAFDARFTAYMQTRFGAAMAALREGAAAAEEEMSPREMVARAGAQPGNYTLQLQAGRALMQRGDTTGALVPLERARALFPEYAGAEGPYPLLVRAHLARGDRRGAGQLLRQMLALGELPHDAYTMLADLAIETGDTATAIDALDALMYVNPYDVARHEQLAALAARAGNRAMAVRERRAIVALKPVDRAAALYNLAVAYREAGDVANARRTVLRALEDAPNYERAQTLLLELRRAP
jgi:tetratricopeptide (TPR) repeat protein